MLVDHLQCHFLALFCFLSNGPISLQIIIRKLLANFAELSNPKAYNMLQLTVFITEADYNRFQLLLKIADLTIQGVQLALSLCLLTDLQVVYLFGEHQHAVLGEGLCWVRDGVRW